MKRTVILLALVALLLPGALLAEIFTVTLDNGNTFETRYRPKLSYPDEDKVMFQTATGNWISLPRESVVDVAVDFETKGYGLVIDTTTISLGFAPNETRPQNPAASDPQAALLQFLAGQAANQQSYSVDQFVNTDDAGQGGFPSSFGAGSSFGPGTSGPGVPLPPPVLQPPAPQPPPPASGGDGDTSAEQ